MSPSRLQYDDRIYLNSDYTSICWDILRVSCGRIRYRRQDRTNSFDACHRTQYCYHDAHEPKQWRKKIRPTCSSILYRHQIWHLCDFTDVFCHTLFLRGAHALISKYLPRKCANRIILFTNICISASGLCVDIYDNFWTTRNQKTFCSPRGWCSEADHPTIAYLVSVCEYFGSWHQ